PSGDAVVAAAFELGEQRESVGEVELPVAVDGDDVLAARGGDRRRQRTAVAAIGRVGHDPQARNLRAHSLEHLCCAVCAAVVAQYDFGRLWSRGEHGIPFGDDGFDALFLVETWRRN